MIYITGDTHGQFDRIQRFCNIAQPSREDVMIILGDAGINYYDGRRDENTKKMLAQLPITIFSIHGNHEQRPETIPSYHLTSWHGGEVYVEDVYPNLLFAKDGDIYDLGGRQTLVIGGAYSVDKQYRLAHGWNWWPDEQPSEVTKRRVEAVLDQRGWKVDVVLTHTTPLKYMPVEVFLPQIEQSGVDNSTEVWLDRVEARLTYQHWYAGHYHVNKDIDRLSILFESIREFRKTEKWENENG